MENSVIQPEELTNNKNYSTDLETASNSIILEIRHCDAQVTAWQNHKKKFLLQMNEILHRIQKECGNSDIPRKKSKEDSTPELIRVYLEKCGPSRTTDIRKFLLDNGKRTNPGVALSRMVKGKAIVHMDRGVYGLA